MLTPGPRDRPPAGGCESTWATHPGPARRQDVEDLLAAGIDVISAVRVGHLDSLADVAAKITGAAPRQTVPDSVVRAAGEVELVDVAPEALRDRLARGHIYPPDQAEAALGGWFWTGNLSALRELALLWLAAALAGGPRRHLPGGGDPGSGQARERVVVALSGGPEGETLIRRAARIAARSAGPAGGARRPAWPPGPLWPRRARRPAPAGRVGRRHLPPARRPGHPRRAAGLRPRAQRHPAGAGRHPPAPGWPRCGPQPASDRGSSAVAADSTCTSSPAHPPPTAPRPRRVNLTREGKQ